MDALHHYIKEVLGIDLSYKPLLPAMLNMLPLYIRDSYKLYDITLYHTQFILAEIHDEEAFSNSQIEKHLAAIKDLLHKKAVLLSKTLSSINRKRLIEKRVNFIVPGKQLFMPDLLLDLRETFSNRREPEHRNKLLPSAQFILLYHLIHHYIKPPLKNLSFKELAEKFGYTPMAITNAVENLRYNELCTIKGVKEKFINFDRERFELWSIAKPVLINPVLKRVYVDKKPAVFMLQSNASALPEYSDINPGNQSFYAIEKSVFYNLLETETLVNLNDYQGIYCLEVWKYDPVKMIEGMDPEGEDVVDPLSLYLSMKNIEDERIEMALDQIEDRNIW